RRCRDRCPLPRSPPARIRASSPADAENEMNAPALAVTVGDPVGIGPAIAAQVLSDVASRDDQHGIAVADQAVRRRAVEVLGLDVDLRAIADWSTPSAGEGVIDVFDIGVLGNDLPDWGVVDARAGRAAVTAIEVATKA